MRRIAVAVALLTLSGIAADAAPAARVGDATTRGTILPPGAPTVLICGMPAARVGDMANTVVSNGLTLVPTVVPIATGSATVMIAGKPATRIGDVTANGDKIAVGCPTVIIGG
jgi:uncharacterized Zn-binding protein involved in type VI secretion